MKHLLKKFFSKKNLMSHLLRDYATLMIFLSTAAFGLVGGTIAVQKQNQAQLALQEAIQSTTRMMNDKQSSGRAILNQLTGSYEKIENITAYLTKPTNEYFSYIYTRQKELNEFFLLPNELRSLYVNYDDLSSLYLTLSPFPEYLESTEKNRTGIIKKGTPKDRKDAFYITKPIYQGSIRGTLFIGFEELDFETSLRNLNTFDGLSIYVISESANQLYTYHDKELNLQKRENLEKIISGKLTKNSDMPMNELQEDFYIKTQSYGNDYRILAVLDKSAVKKNILFTLLPSMIGVAFLNFILIISLIRIFRRYSKQIDTVSETLGAASSGRLDTRIDTKKMEFELRQVSEDINHMLDSIDKYMNDIYKLELKQQEAHMRALQAQINPHFLYNTLEYIRMSALSEGSEELADVVYAFSTLLRNNISAEKMITLREELDFCEKYVYLYQMRFPNRVAYHFTIEKKLNSFVIPKFVIQPLVENYFKHGIDFTKKNNVISVKAYQKQNEIIIEVQDNGKGITIENLKALQEKLVNRVLERSNSIGLQNVDERMKGFYGDHYTMELVRNEVEGLTVILHIKKEGKNVQGTSS